MQKEAIKKAIAAWWMISCFLLLSASCADCQASEESRCRQDAYKIANRLDYSSNDRFRILLTDFFARCMSTGEVVDLFCFFNFLNTIDLQQLTLAQYKQVLFLQAQTHFLLGEFNAAHQQYLQLKWLITDESDPMRAAVNRRLKESREKGRPERLQEAFEKRQKSLQAGNTQIVVIPLLLLLFLFAAGKGCKHWNKKKYKDFQGSDPILPARIEASPITLEKMRRQDGRVSKKALEDYRKGSKPFCPGESDDRSAVVRLLVEGHKMIERVNMLAPYPIALIAKILGPSRMPTFWQYTIAGFLVIVLKALLCINFVPDYNVFERSVGLFLISALIIASLTCLRIMARVTVNSLDEIVSMLEAPDKVDSGRIPASVLRIEKNMDFLFRSPWQFFIVLLVFFIVVGKILCGPCMQSGGISPETGINMIFASLIVLIGAPIIWMLIGSVSVLNDISRMEDLAINPLSPLKTMGLEKWTAVISTYGVSSSIVLTFGCSIPVLNNLVSQGRVGSLFFLLLVLPLLFFYWIYPYSKISSMVKQQKIDRMHFVKTRILHLFNDWMRFEENQLEKMRECCEYHPEDKCYEFFDFRTRMAEQLRVYLEPMNRYYEMFKRIDESPHSHISFGSILELGKALGIPSLFALFSALLL